MADDEQTQEPEAQEPETPQAAEPDPYAAAIAALDSYIYSTDSTNGEVEEDEDYSPFVAPQEKRRDKEVAEIAKVTKQLAERQRQHEEEEKAAALYAQFFSDGEVSETAKRLGKALLRPNDDRRTMRDKINTVKAEAARLDQEAETIRQQAKEEAERQALSGVSGLPIAPTPVRTVPQEIEEARQNYLKTHEDDYLVEVTKHILGEG